jgi:hypothetical protein
MQIQLKVLQTQKTGQAKMLKDAQANKDFMKKVDPVSCHTCGDWLIQTLPSVVSVVREGLEACHGCRSDRVCYVLCKTGFELLIIRFSWELVGMQFVSSLTAIPTAISHAFMSHASASADSTADGTNGFSKGSPAPAATPMADTTSPNGVNSQPNTNTLIDPAVTCVQQVLDQVNFIKLLLAGKGGKPDWERIQTTDVCLFPRGLHDKTLTCTFCSERTKRSPLH